MGCAASIQHAVLADGPKAAAKGDSGAGAGAAIKLTAHTNGAGGAAPEAELESGSFVARQPAPSKARRASAQTAGPGLEDPKPLSQATHVVAAAGDLLALASTVLNDTLPDLAEALRDLPYVGAVFGAFTVFFARVQKVQSNHRCVAWVRGCCVACRTDTVPSLQPTAPPHPSPCVRASHAIASPSSLFLPRALPARAARPAPLPPPCPPPPLSPQQRMPPPHTHARAYAGCLCR